MTDGGIAAKTTEAAPFEKQLNLAGPTAPQKMFDRPLGVDQSAFPAGAFGGEMTHDRM